MARHRTPLQDLAEAGRTRLSAVTSEDEHERSVIGLIQRLGRVSVNLKPSDLESFLAIGRRRNAFECAAEESVSTGRREEDVLRAWLGYWYELRVAFELQAGNGQHFHYGALNVGGMGAPGYGRYCVIDGRPLGDAHEDLVWIAEDSLRLSRFRTSAGLDWSRLAAWVAPSDLVCALVVLKFRGHWSVPDQATLQATICSDRDYVEALSTDALTTEDVEEVRSDTDAVVQRRALDALLSGAGLSEELDLALHERIRRLADEREVPWVEVT